jgi:uncharacterized membrane protein YkvA (DUF1232 family)
VTRGRLRAIAGFVPDCAVLFKRLATDTRVPRWCKLLLAGVAAYLAFPLDLIPDFIPVLGQLDDALVVAFALRRIVSAAGEAVVTEHWPGPDPSLRTVLRLAGARP